MIKKNLGHKKIKIVHIAQSAGGVAEYLKNFLKHIDTNKYENILVASNDYKKTENEFNKITNKITSLIQNYNSSYSILFAM